MKSNTKTQMTEFEQILEVLKQTGVTEPVPAYRSVTGDGNAQSYSSFVCADAKASK